MSRSASHACTLVPITKPSVVLTCAGVLDAHAEATDTMKLLVVAVSPAIVVRSESRGWNVELRDVPLTVGIAVDSSAAVHTLVALAPVAPIEPVSVKLEDHNARSPVTFAEPLKFCPQIVLVVERIGAFTTDRSTVVVGLVIVILPSADATDVTVPLQPPHQPIGEPSGLHTTRPYFVGSLADCTTEATRLLPSQSTIAFLTVSLDICSVCVKNYNTLFCRVR